MKEIKATIQPHMRANVIRALHELPHFPGVTVFKGQGQGRGRGQGGAYVVTEDSINYHPKDRIEIICADHLAGEIVAVITKTAHTGNQGDGIITVADLESVTRIRTAESADAAL